MEGIDNFAALFIRLTNPQIDDILEEFNEITSILFDPSENNIIVVQFLTIKQYG